MGETAFWTASATSDGTSATLSRLTWQAEQLALAGIWDDRAAEVNERIMALNPRCVGACTRLARCRLEDGRPDEAERLYRRALELDPSSRVAANQLEAFMRLRGYRAAAAEIRVNELFSRGVQARTSGNSDLAIAILERAVCVRDGIGPRLALAGAYRDGHRPQEAETQYRDVLSDGPNPPAQLGLAAVLRDQGRLREAWELIQEIRQESVDDLAGIAGDVTVNRWE